MNFSKLNNHGIMNEIRFTKVFDKKIVKELEQPYQELLYELFDNLKENDYIECWKSKFKEKADIKIRIKENIKGISIKMGENNSVHQEHINSLSNYLLNIGISYDIINKLRAYNFGLIEGHQVDAETYKKRKYNDIIEIKKSLNDLYIKINLIIRFLFKGTENQFYDTDAIIHGTPESFLWATKSEILKYLLLYKNNDSTNVKIGPLYIQCRNRNLNNNIRSTYNEEYIQVKWYTIKKDLYLITKLRNTEKNSNIINN